jgi:hypothetical protein
MAQLVHWMCYGVDNLGVGVPFLAWKTCFFFFITRQGLAPAQPPLKWSPVAVSSGVNRFGREIDQSPKSVGVKNDGTLPLIP